MKIFAICAVIAIIINFLLNIRKLLCFRKSCDQAENKVRILNNNRSHYSTWAILSPIWILICIGNMFSYSGTPERAEAYFILIWFWIIAFAVNLFMLYFSKYAFITHNSILNFGVNKNLYPNENCRYKIMEEYGDFKILEIYWKKSKKPLKYGIIENKNELKQILELHYEKYADSI